MADMELMVRDPREFLKRNLLVMMGAVPNVEGMYGWELEDTSDLGTTGSRQSKYFWKGNYQIPVWHVRLAPGDRPGFPAYWLPYEGQSRQQASVGSDAPMLLTASMTGCSFGAVKRADGGLEAYHVNYQTKDGHLDEARMAREIAHCPHRLDQVRYRERARGRAVVGPSRQAKFGATVVGVNGLRGGWKLFAQQWETPDGDRYIYHELLDV